VTWSLAGGKDAIQFIERPEFMTPFDATTSRGGTSAEEDADAGGPNRRVLLQQLLALAFATALDWHDITVATAFPLDRRRFVELSQKLCAMQIEDGPLAGAIQSALADQYSHDDFKRIAELLHSATPQDIDRLVASSGLQNLAKSIVSTWYSGLLGTGDRTRVLAYDDALAWRATGYAKAPGTCGEFGDWIAQPPTTPDLERRP
jgi:Membrane bound FAD containing D-sorbitol dehydrogenase